MIPTITAAKTSWQLVFLWSLFTTSIYAQTATLSPGLSINYRVSLKAESNYQNAKNSGDISFDKRIAESLLATTVTDSIIRGPYLQMGNQNAITIRWATNKAVDSKVTWGLAPGSFNNVISDTTKTTEHEVRITGLIADTKYYYSIGTSEVTLEQTGSNFFNTAPSQTTTRKIRIAAYGDCGTNSTVQQQVKNAFINYMGSNTTDLWLLLGDNAYNAGLNDEYQSNFFNVYKNDLLKNILLYPTLGNHDYANDPGRQEDHNIPYLSFFTLPKNGECGGLASGKKEYYSFDYGDIHFICLDAYGEEQHKRFYDTTSTQILWLKRDLAANQRKWTIAFWHHPPYTMGSHNSDKEPDLAAIRKNLIRILERNGVDLILNGHSHDYERSYFIHDNFGLENTFSFAAHTKNKSGARYDGSVNSCPYISTAAKIKHGTVYIVAGSAGKIGGTEPSFPHAAMYYSNATNGGSLLIEIQGNRLDAKFIATDSTVKDQFTIFKDVNKTIKLSVSSGKPDTLIASWTGDYTWSTGASTQSVIVNPTASGIYYVSDNSNAAGKCLSDTFHVKIVTAKAVKKPSGFASVPPGKATTRAETIHVGPVR